MVTALAVSVVGCKKKKTNKNIVGDWKATSYTETTSSESKDATWYDHDNDFSTPDQKGISKTSVSGSSSLTNFSETETTVSPSGTTVITTTTRSQSTSISISLNEDGTAVQTYSSTLNSQTLSTSPANTCPGTDGAGQWCDGTYTFTTDNTVSYSATGIWYWGNDTDDRSSIVVEADGDISVWTVTLDKDVLTLSKTDTNSSTQIASNGAGSDTYTETVTTTIELAK